METRLWRNCNLDVQRLIYEKVASDWDTSEIGNLQIDFIVLRLLVRTGSVYSGFRYPQRQIVALRRLGTPAVQNRWAAT